MALFNETLEGRWQRRIGTIHSLKGGSAAPQVSPEITHVIPLVDEYELYSHLFPEGTTRFSSGNVRANAVAAQLSAVQFQMLTPGVIAIIEFLLLNGDCPAASLYRVSLAGAAAGFVSPAQSNILDTRELPNKRSAVINYLNTNAVAFTGNEIARVNMPTTQVPSVFVPEARGIVLVNPGVLTIYGGAVNQLVSCTLVHRERPASAAELRSA